MTRRYWQRVYPVRSSHHGRSGNGAFSDPVTGIQNMAVCSLSESELSTLFLRFQKENRSEDHCINVPRTWYYIRHIGLDPKKTDERKDFGIELHAAIRQSDRQAWQAGMGLQKIAVKSFLQARQSDVKYCFRARNTCKCSATDLEYNDHGDDNNTRTITLTGRTKTYFRM